MKFMHYIFVFLFVFFLNILNAHAIEFQKINATDAYPEIWYMQTKAVPTVSMRISFPLGSAYDPDNKLGLTTMLASTMDEGAGLLDSDTFRKELVDNQITLYYSASFDSFTLNIDFLNFDKSKALELANLSLNKPRFDKEAIGLMQEQLITSLENNRKDPNAIANNLLRNEYYKEHSFSRPSQGTIKTLKNITRDDLIDFHKKIISHKPFVSVVGDISKKEIISFVTQLLKNLPKNPSPLKQIPDYIPELKSNYVHVYSDVPQSNIIIATPSIKRTDNTFFATYIATHILGGGGFGSKLVNNLRENNGLTYSVLASLDSSLYDGRMLINFSTDNKKLDKALTETQDTLKNLAKNGITEQELQKAKTYLKGQYILAFETNNDISNLGQNLHSYGLPYDYSKKRDALFDAVTVEEVNNVMKKLFQQPLTIIVVGGNRKIDNFKLISVDEIKF